jgi:two-component system alkaline phosphatase synthesis response regulator PhoP/two-component system response regulator VicR
MSQPQVNMSSRLKILISDDEPFVLRLLQVHFERRNFDVRTATNGREALDLLQQEIPDVCLLDVMMPYVSGLEVLTKIRSNPETESLPVFMLTVKAQVEEIVEGYHRGADMYLTKPFDPEEIVRYVELIFEHSH